MKNFISKADMRGIFFALFLLIEFSIFGQEVKVFSHRDPEVDFNKYKTYYWAMQVDDHRDEPHYFLNDLLLKADIRDAVKGEMLARGYQAKEINPDLIVNFRVFDRATTLRGFEGYGSKYWSQSEFHSAADKTLISIEPGTLIISLLDRREGVLVWQGFASGLTSDEGFIKDEGKVRETVNLIFQEYGLQANEYTRR